MSKRYCRFCGAVADSREHVLPDWLKGVLPEQGKTWTVGQEQIKGDQRKTREFTTSPLSQRVRWVCEDCNTIWMSRLEGEAKPILSPMIRGMGREFHANGQRLVAMWAFKTAAMFDLMSLGGGEFPAEHLHWLYEHREDPEEPLPPHMHVWLAGHNVKNMAPIYRQHRLHLWTEDGSQSSIGNEANGYVATVTVGHLALQIFGTTDRSGFNIKDSGQFNLQIWPRPGGPLTWPPPRLLDRKGVHAWADSMLTDPAQG
jgi:hypothetical protein